eukprot:CAMPEP_0179985246 /NCGR_PEP_ID=MMETSP0984-20121128/1582_1 /TAXON_ID=483367 /ORGANISM="non described non described, Strain CCMP 2436" /LENGTH=106 /DNA_ID=CAMNT_0021903923 /DNA_START=45 /DNA_END=365 /DNA_ORIENTATION=-
MPGSPFISPMDGVQGVGDPAGLASSGHRAATAERVAFSSASRAPAWLALLRLLRRAPVEVILVAGRAGSRPVRYQGSDGSMHSDGGRARALSVSRVGRWLRTAWAE